MRRYGSHVSKNTTVSRNRFRGSHMLRLAETSEILHCLRWPLAKRQHTKSGVAMDVQIAYSYTANLHPADRVAKFCRIPHIIVPSCPGHMHIPYHHGSRPLKSFHSDQQQTPSAMPSSSTLPKHPITHPVTHTFLPPMNADEDTQYLLRLPDKCFRVSFCGAYSSNCVSSSSATGAGVRRSLRSLFCRRELEI